MTKQGALTRVIWVNWLHRLSGQDYQKMNKPVGGTLKVTLNGKQHCTYDEIFGNIRAAYINSLNRPIFDKCESIQLANYDRVVFENFGTANESENPDFWKFVESNLSSNGKRKSIFILTTGEEDNEENITKREKKGFSASDDSDYNSNKSDPSPNFSLLTKLRQEKKVNRTQQILQNRNSQSGSDVSFSPLISPSKIFEQQFGMQDKRMVKKENISSSNLQFHGKFLKAFDVKPEVRAKTDCLFQQRQDANLIMNPLKKPDVPEKCNKLQLQFKIITI